MAYTGQTDFYAIPYGKDGDTIEEPDNQQQVQMIDWLLQASTGVAGNGVIEEGDYNQSPDTGSGISVFINPSGGVSIKACFKSALASSASTVIWKPLVSGNFYYLYLQWASTLYTNPASFTTVFRTTPYAITNKQYLLLATYDLTSGYPGVIDTNPDGKMYASGFTEHIATRTDPHSAFLTQTNLAVTGSCWVGLNNSETMRVAQENPASTTPLMTLVHAVSGQPVIYAPDEFVVRDQRLKTQLSEATEVSFDNGGLSIVGAVNINTDDISTNTGNIATNTSDISTNAGNIATNTSDISTNAGNIATNTSDISTNAGNIATNTADISTNAGDIATHIADTANPHTTSIANIGSGTLAQLNSALSDFNVDATGTARPPTNHASNHTNGTDDIQSATNVQKGLATATQITDIESNNSHRVSTGNPHSTQGNEVPYNNSISGLLATDIQAAIDELAIKLEACCPTQSSSSSSNTSSSSSSNTSSSSSSNTSSSSSSS